MGWHSSVLDLQRSLNYLGWGTLPGTPILNKPTVLPNGTWVRAFGSASLAQVLSCRFPHNDRPALVTFQYATGEYAGAYGVEYLDQLTVPTDAEAQEELVVHGLATL